MSNQAKVVMYATAMCPYCMAARMLFKNKGIEYEEISVSGDPELRQKMTAMSGSHTVPQIFIDDQPVGGFTDISKLAVTGQLDKLLGLK